MPSSYSASARFTLQATGENNNTWGVILNQGVFQLVDDNVNGVLSFALSTTKTLTTVNGGPDEARMAFLNVTGGIGGSIVIPPVSKGYFVRNNSAGPVAIGTGSPQIAAFYPGDVGPVFTDGTSVWQLQIDGKILKTFITDADQLVINYVNAAISQASISLPPATAANVNKALIIRDQGGGVFAWVPSAIAVADVTGLQAALDANSAADQDFAVAMALLL